jgi:hypothetical protein
MAHHGDAVGPRRDCLAELLDHALAVPAGEQVIDLGPGVGGRLARTIVDDVGEGIALGAADEEADIDLAAPLVA